MCQNLVTLEISGLTLWFFFNNVTCSMLTTKPTSTASLTITTHFKSFSHFRSFKVSPKRHLEKNLYPLTRATLRKSEGKKDFFSLKYKYVGTTTRTVQTIIRRKINLYGSSQEEEKIIKRKFHFRGSKSVSLYASSFLYLQVSLEDIFTVET